MKIVKPYINVEKFDGVKMMKKIERAGRTCYKSHVTSDDSYKKFLANIISSGHESVIEHEKITIRVLTDRGALWDITRHRITSFSVESSRYCNYSKDRFEKEIKFMEPFYIKNDEQALKEWTETMETAEKNYFKLAEQGYKPDVCRMLLPTSLATEIVMTANLREWRHILTLRCSDRAHPTIRQFTIPLLLHLKEELPEIFSDIPYDENFDPKDYAKLEVIDEI